MKWIKRTIRAWLADEPELVKASSYVSPQRIDSPGINFKITRATGGLVLEVNQYDHKTDRSNSSVYIIPDTCNFGEEISKIITFEAIR